LKSKFSNCNECILTKQKMVIGTTNCEDDLSKVELLVLSKSPSSADIEQNRPLMNDEFEKSGLSKIPYYISYTVLCSNPDKDINAFNNCKPNLEKLLEVLNPKLVLILDGAYKNDKYKIYTIDGSKELSEDFNNVLNILNGKKSETIKNTDNKSVFYFQHPDWMNNKDTILFDIQRFPQTEEVIYIMKTSEGKKYHKEHARDSYFYVKNEHPDNADYLSSIKDTELIFEDLYNYEYKDTKTIYEGDVKIELKRSIDYYLTRTTEEPDIPLNILYFDIEVYNFGKREFPDPKDANSPINAISYKLNGGTTKVLLARLPQMDKNLPENVVNIEYDIMPDEKSLLKKFCEEIKRIDPDILAGWNSSGFDIPYIFNRMKKVGVHTSTLSPIGLTSINPLRYGDAQIGGIYLMDMLNLYKSLTESVEPTYNLGAICRKNLGEDKVGYQGSLDDIYSNNIKNFIEYSGQDSNLLYELNLKLGHIELRNELRRLCSSTWKASETTMGQIDPLVVSYAKKLGMICKNARGNKYDNEVTESLPGAYVRNPIAGLHSWLIDLDFASLYPSIIMSFNIGPETYHANIDPETAHTYIYYKNKFPDTVDVVINPLKKDKENKTMTKKEFFKFMDDSNSMITIAGTIFKGHNVQFSFFNRILRYLLDSRKVYKTQMNEEKLKGNEEIYKKFYNMQWAMKILANSLYGVLAQKGFRMFNIDLAKSITLTGQESIKFAGYHVGEYMKNGTKTINPKFMDNYNDRKIPYLIYTDTDSVFLNCGDYLIDKGKLNIL